jgi:hypothetical protein
MPLDELSIRLGDRFGVGAVSLQMAADGIDHYWCRSLGARVAFRLLDHFNFSYHAPFCRTRLDYSNALLFLRFLRRARSSWQLQHSRLLTLTETGEQHNLPVGELQCVVMHVRLLFPNLPEPSHFLSELFAGHPHREEAQSMLALDLFVERDLRAGKKAHGHVRFSE